MIRRHFFFGGRQAGAAILRFLMTETQARNLRVSETEKRVVVAFGNLDRSGELALDNCSVRVVLKFGGIILAVRVVVDSLIRDPRERDACIVLQGLPRPQAFFDLLGKHRGIARRLERFLRHLPGDLVISVAVRAPADKHGSDGERPHHADDTDNITQNTIVAPLIQGFFFCFGKTVVADACPELLRTIVAIRSEELFRAHEAKGIEVVGGHDVGAALAAVQREQRGAYSLAARFVGEHSAVFVVRMRRDHEQARSRTKLLEALPQRRRSAVERKSLRRRLGIGTCGCGRLGAH